VTVQWISSAVPRAQERSPAERAIAADAREAPRESPISDESAPPAAKLSQRVCVGRPHRLGRVSIFFGELLDPAIVLSA